MSSHALLSKGARGVTDAADPGKSTQPPTDRWVAAGLITGPQADAISAFEAGRLVPEAIARPHAVPLVAEALGYLGAALALVGAGFAVGRVWNELLAPWARPALLGALAVALWIAGRLIRRFPDEAAQRLTSVLWFLSWAAALSFFVELVGDTLGASNETAAFAAGIGSVAYGAALWIPRRSVPQLIALFLAAEFAVASGVWLVVSGGTAYALSLWAVGLAWMILTWQRVVRPTRVAYGLGAVALLVGPQIIFAQVAGWGAAFGIVTAAALMVASVADREPALLGFGAAGVFLFLTEFVLRYFASTTGVPLALFLAGVALIGVAVLTVRLRGLTKPSHGEGSRDGSQRR